MADNERDNRIEERTAEAELAALEKEIAALKATTAKRAAAKNLKKALAFARFRVMIGVILVAVAITAFMVSRDTSAWFSINQTVGSDGVGAQTEAPDAVAAYYAYVYEAKASKVIYTGDSEENFDDPTVTALDMQFYDMIFKERNRYTPAILRIELTSLKKDWRNGGIVDVTVNRDTTLPNDAMTDHFTSVMRFTIVQDKAWYADAEAAVAANPAKDIGQELYFNLDEDLYGTYENISGRTSQTTVFTTRTQGVVHKDDSITLSVPFTSSDIVDGILNIYLYITYDHTLLSAYQAATGITGGETIGRTVLMEDDIDSLSVSFRPSN